MSITLETLTEKLNTTILKNGKKYKSGSIKFYRNEFRKILGDKKSITFSDITYDKVKDFIKDLTNSQKINIVVMVIKLYQFYGKMDTDHYRSIVKLYDGFMDDKKSKGNELSDKEKKTFQSWDDILETRKKIKKNLRLTELYNKDKLTRYELKALRQYILVLLLTEAPPRRARDYIMKFAEGKAPDDKHNYIVRIGKNKFKMIYNEYKTADIYGQVEAELPNKASVSRPINLYLKQADVKEGEYFFSWTSSPLNSPQLSTMLKDTMEKFGSKSSGFNVFRKSYITDNFKDDKETTDKQKELSKKMGHSIGTAMNTYNKNKDDDDSE
jgi:hypothetical protein